LARIAFLGTPAVAASVLETLHSAGHEIAVVVTQPDKRRSRGGGSDPSPVKQVAQRLGLPVAHSAEAAAEAGATLGVVVAYGQIIKASLLEKVPMVNLHFSLLPRWRGAAPVERAILAGDCETGVCLMEVVEELDAGGIYDIRRVAIGKDETAEELTARLGEIGADMLVSALADLPGSLGTPVPQEGEPTYAHKVDPAERHLDWSKESGQLARIVRIGRAWTTFRGRRLIVWRALAEEGRHRLAPGQIDSDGAVGTGAGTLRLLEVQPEGKKRLPAADWLRGTGLEPGERLG
jgi:methionyl-tRNA formyltransferase